VLQLSCLSRLNVAFNHLADLPPGMKTALPGLADLECDGNLRPAEELLRQAVCPATVPSAPPQPQLQDPARYSPPQGGDRDRDRVCDGRGPSSAAGQQPDVLVLDGGDSAGECVFEIGAGLRHGSQDAGSRGSSDPGIDLRGNQSGGQQGGAPYPLGLAGVAGHTDGASPTAGAGGPTGLLAGLPPAAAAAMYRSLLAVQQGVAELRSGRPLSRAGLVPGSGSAAPEPAGTHGFGSSPADLLHGSRLSSGTLHAMSRPYSASLASFRSAAAAASAGTGAAGGSTSAKGDRPGTSATGYRGWAGGASWRESTPRPAADRGSNALLPGSASGLSSKASRPESPCWLQLSMSCAAPAAAPLGRQTDSGLAALLAPPRVLRAKASAGVGLAEGWTQLQETGSVGSTAVAASTAPAATGSEGCLARGAGHVVLPGASSSTGRGCGPGAAGAQGVGALTYPLTAGLRSMMRHSRGHGQPTITVQRQSRAVIRDGHEEGVGEHGPGLLQSGRISSNGSASVAGGSHPAAEAGAHADGCAGLDAALATTRRLLAARGLYQCADVLQDLRMHEAGGGEV
jgi:hypothetical protein